MKVYVIIPARYHSSRFEGKLLKKLGDKTILQHVFEAASSIDGIQGVLIATDDERILESASKYCDNIVMTRKDHLSGTDRCAEVASTLTEADVVINLQGDEPFIDSAAIYKLIKSFEEERVEIASLRTLIAKDQDVSNSNVVKVVCDKDNDALYFSRSVIPNSKKSAMRHRYYRHVGVYGFRRKTLITLSKLPQSQLEITESLEQLRWQENGYKIKMVECQAFGPGIDTVEDLNRAEEYLNTI